METAALKTKPKEGYRIMGLSLPAFAVITAVVFGGTYLGVLPKGMIGAFALMLVVGEIFSELGNHIPIVKDYLGGGPIVIIFGTAALVAYGLLPKGSIDIMKNFMVETSGGFLDFYIAALITGSILGMSRELLIKAAIRYLPSILGGVIASLGLVGLIGVVSGYGAKQAILYIGIPIMGGGMGAGAVPLSKIFGSTLAKDPKEMLSIMVPAVALGNALSIVAAGLLDRLGKSKPSLTGNGQLMRIKAEAVVDDSSVEIVDYKKMGTGLLIATTFFVFGNIVAKVKILSEIHPYAWMIISVAVVKSIGILPRKYEESAFQWFQFMMKNLTGVLLVGIGVAYTDLNQVIAAITPTYLLLVGATVLGAIIGAGFTGKILGFFPIEAAITAGLCMSNMGGTGDVAVLSASKRMNLMPFAQISSRLGGAFILILASLLLKIFM